MYFYCPHEGIFSAVSNLQFTREEGKLKGESAAEAYFTEVHICTETDTSHKEQVPAWNLFQVRGKNEGDTGRN